MALISRFTITETIEDLSNIFKNTEINFIKTSLENSGFVKGFCIKDND